MSTTAKTATKTGARTMTKSAFADLLSVSRSAVSVWIRRRKLTAPALRPNGMIDVDRAKRQLAETIGYGRAPSPEAAAARSKGVAENALVSRLARARADLLAVQAADRDFTKAVAAGRYVLVDDVERPFVRSAGRRQRARKLRVETAPDVILAVTGNGVALDRLRGSFASMWLRVRGLDDTERNGAADLAPRPPAPRPDAAPAAGHPGVDGPPAARRPRPESEVERLGRLRCGKAESAARDALEVFHQRLGHHCDAAACHTAASQKFCDVRAGIERALPGLVTAVGGAGDGRRAVLAARQWLRSTRVLLSRSGEDGAGQSEGAATG